MENVARKLLNAKIELSEAITEMGELCRKGKVSIREFEELYHIKKELKDYLDEYRTKIEEER